MITSRTTAALALAALLVAASTGCHTYETLSGHEAFVQCVAFSPDGRRVASGSDDATVRVWAMEDYAELRALEGHTESVWGVCFSPDGRMIASAGVDGTVRVWSARHGTPVHVFGEGYGLGADGQPVIAQGPPPDHVPAIAVAWSPDGDTIAAGFDDNTIELYSLERKELIGTLRGATRVLAALAFSPDGALIAATSGPRVRLRSVRDGRLVRLLDGQHEGQQIHAVAFDPSGARLASAGDEGKVVIWDLATGLPERTLTVSPTFVRGVGFSPDGKILAAGSWNGEVTLWRVADGAKVGEWDGQRDMLRAVAYSPRGDRIAAAGGDETVRVWPVVLEGAEPAAAPAAPPAEDEEAHE